MGSHLLPIEQGRHLHLPCHRHVCQLCPTGVLGNERHMLLAPALADIRDKFPALIAACSDLCHGLAFMGVEPANGQQVQHRLP